MRVQGPRAPTRQLPGPRGEVLKVTLQGGPACSGAGRLAMREVGRGGAGRGGGQGCVCAPRVSLSRQAGLRASECVVSV